MEALHPGELAGVVKEALEPYYDHESPRILRDENYRISKKAEQMLQEIRPKLEEALSGLRVEGLEHLDLEHALDENFQAPKPSHKVPDDNGHWLLDTSLEYDKQIEIYRHWKDGRANSG